MGLPVLNKINRWTIKSGKHREQSGNLPHILGLEAGHSGEAPESWIPKPYQTDLYAPFAQMESEEILDLYLPDSASPRFARVRVSITEKTVPFISI